MKPQKKFNSFSELEKLSENQPAPQEYTLRKHDGKGKNVTVLLDIHGRKGKQVTIVSGLHHNPTTLEEISRILKQHCGAGGTVKEGKIEIQGDQRERVSTKLRELNYAVE
jgi:predicted translation initiation factor SUI1